MRPLLLLVLAFQLCINAFAQKIEDGLWNAGRAFSMTSMDNDSVILQKQLSLVQVYPGFSVVKSTYDILNLRKDSFSAKFHWIDTMSTEHRFFHSLNNLSSAGMKVLMGKDTLRPQVVGGSLVFDAVLPPAKLSTITTYQLTPNNQGKLSGDETVKELNAFIFSFDRWNKQGPRQVFIKLMGGLTLTNIKGIYPKTVTGTMQQLKWMPDSLNKTMVVWYEGQAPDYKFEKKVLPQQHLLYEDINSFDVAFFDGPGFKAIEKTDFTTNSRSLLGSVIYFILFSIPWIILIGFIVFLLRKPKKKTNT
ncbi:MAG TPA: hypothetical protein VK166_01985 [Chitinophagaceae bacterium]|nr:hypothetical protein [Chitinophagaceae bacterium]